MREKRFLKQAAKQIESEAISDDFRRYQKDSQWNSSNKIQVTKSSKAAQHSRFMEKVDEDRKVKQEVHKSKFQDKRQEMDREMLEKLQFELSQLEKETNSVKNSLKK